MKVTKIILGSLSSMLLVVALFFTLQNTTYLRSDSSKDVGKEFYRLSNELFFQSASADLGTGNCSGEQCTGTSESGQNRFATQIVNDEEKCCRKLDPSAGDQEIFTN
jgi:hypothetical protein